MDTKKNDAFSQNIKTVLQYLFRNKNTSRTDIAEDTTITPASVSSVIAFLIKKKIVIESGSKSHIAGSGRRRTTLNLNPNSGIAIGLEFNMKGFFIVITNPLGEILIQSHKPLPQSMDLYNINDIIVQLVQETLAPYHQLPIFGLGISIPGHYDDQKQKLLTNNILWESVDLAYINQAFSFPVYITNNVESMALSRYLFNSLSTPERFSYLYIHYGMHYAYFDSKNILRPQPPYAGEIGHSVVDMDGPLCECGKKGCLQTLISHSWILKNARFLLQNSSTTKLTSFVNSPEELTLSTVIDAYTLNDKFFVDYLNRGIQGLAAMIANILILQDSEKIIINSELLQHDCFFQQLKDNVAQHLRFIPHQNIPSIEILDYNIYAGAIGSCALTFYKALLE